MMNLTRDNYFSPENTAISSTKVRDFLKSKELYYKRYVTNELPFESTPSTTLGKLVDSVIEYGSLDNFKKRYQVAVLKRDNAELFAAQKEMDPEFLITADVYYRVVSICDKIFRSPFFDFYNPLITEGNKVQVQVPLWTAITDVGTEDKFTSFNICGMLDFLTIRWEDHKMVGYIDDLKTTNATSLRSAKTWAWHVMDYGYHRQMACYRLLVQSAYPEIERIVCRHFVIGTSKADYFPIRLFKFTDAMLDKGQTEFLKVAADIAKEQDFIDRLPSWEEAEEIPELSSEEDIEVIGDEEMTNL